MTTCWMQLLWLLFFFTAAFCHDQNKAGNMIGGGHEELKWYLMRILIGPKQ